MPQPARESFLTERAAMLVEMMVAVSLMGIVFVGLYAGLASGFAVTKLTRENLRATQILVQRMETIRLYRWSQLLSTSPAPIYVPEGFIEYYDPAGLSSDSRGVVYTGRITKGIPTNLPAMYQNNMRLITVELTWTTGNVLRRRELETYVARSGMQNYVFK